MWRSRAPDFLAVAVVRRLRDAGLAWAAFACGSGSEDASQRGRTSAARWASTATARGAGRSRGRFPGLDHLTEFLSRLRRIREEGLSPGALAAWVEYGPDDSPPFDEPVNLDDAKDPRRSATAGELVQPTPPTGTRLREAIESAGRADGETARARFDEIVRAVELKRLRGEPVSDVESQLSALWPRLREAIEAAEHLVNEADGTRTRTLRIDRAVGSTTTTAPVVLQRRRAATRRLSVA
jgi:hypothetical protein